MGEAKYMVAWPAGRLDFQQQKKTAPPIHVEGLIFGIGILLDIFPIMDVIFPIMGGWVILICRLYA